MAGTLDRGILLLDKPEDLTSMQCVEVSKRILNARKAGHSGTLDPKVTGLMLIAFNEATKAMPVFLGQDKEYDGIMRLHGPVEERKLAEQARRFTGSVTQVPPRRSAVVRKPRERQVSSLEILSVEGRDVAFRARCEAGTYIRKLCHDLGEALGAGAHMASLRRTGIGPFRIEEAWSMDQLRQDGEKCLFPLEEALERIGFPVLRAEGSMLEKLRNGLSLEEKVFVKPPEGCFGIADPSGKLVALARSEGKRVKPERIFL